MFSLAGAPTTHQAVATRLFAETTSLVSAGPGKPALRGSEAGVVAPAFPGILSPEFKHSKYVARYARHSGMVWNMKDIKGP